MVKLADIHSSVESPLDNQEILQQIVSAYAKSNRTDIFGRSDLYSSLVKMNQTKDSSQINVDDKEAFMVEAYNQWIENMLNLDDAHIQYLEKSRGMDARQMQQYLRSFGKVSSMNDIKRLKSNPLFDEEINGWELNDGWEHIKSQYISGRIEERISVKHRLYVGCQNQDMWKLAQLFKSKCEEQQIPFYFKLGASSERDDKMVIYADTDNLRNYISVLQEIAQEYPEIIQRCGEPPALTGKIDGWIGIGDEPPKKENGENQSYNTLRADIFENSIEEVLLNDITEFKGKDVTFNGKLTRFNDLFMEQAAQTILENLKNLTKNRKLFVTKLNELGLKESDLTGEKFKEHIKAHLRKKIQKGLDQLINIKDVKTQLGGSNGEAIFTIPTRDGKSISINTYDMDRIIKGMIPIMQQIDSEFMNKVKSQIQAGCKQNGIDDTFCFQQGSKKRFEQIDSVQPIRTNKTKTVQTPQDKQTSKKESSVQKLNINKAKTNTSINSVEIVEILKPELLKQKIELPNGTKIPARQYIQEMVAPHIPSNGIYILNDGSQVSAKQYIEEFILGEGQKKYKGNISKLLSENTRNNNGTITINGEQMNAVEIVNKLSPELMKRKVKLPNGVEIPATQYIQEVVAPHIPSDGKFILKSNRTGIPAKQFIEEAVMFEGQERYNGDINALLEAMTVANNGTISVGIRTKAPRGQSLQQEIETSQSEAQKKETDEAILKQDEERRKENEGYSKKTNEEINNQRKYQISLLKRAITSSRVTSKEFNKAQQRMAERDEMRRLMLIGKNRTEEQERRFIELQQIYQTNQHQVNQQKKDNGMSR